MDISLHSFILVIGMIVIGFIIWDGIKKVRAARSNQLNQTLEGYDDLDAMAGDDDANGFDHLEIKEELLQQALSDEQAPSFEDMLKQDRANTKEAEEHVAKSSSIFEVLDDDIEVDAAPQKPEVAKESKSSDNVVEPIELEDDTFEHFSACDDVIDVTETSQLVAASKVSAHKTTEKQQQLASSVLAKNKQVESKPEDKLRADNIKPDNVKEKQSQRISKEALAAQLAKAQQEAKANAPTAKPVVKEDISIDDKEPVPVLMEPVELGQKVDPNPPKQHELVLPELIQQTLQEEPVFASKPAVEIKASKAKYDPLMEYIDDVQALPVGEKLSERAAAQEIFVINIFKQDGKGLLGKDLNHVFNVCDMRHGEMDIFHRFEKANAQGKIQFSVVNALEPGTFNLATIDELVTPGISLFMSLPGPTKPMEAFDAMAEVALVFARNFNATLHDDTHSDLTPQTLEHYRQRIREFTRKHLSQKK